MSNQRPPEDAYGTAEIATDDQIIDSGLLHEDGPLLGIHDELGPIRVGGQGPITTVAGSRSGKLRDCLGFTICGPIPCIAVDLKAELAAVSFHNQIRWQLPAYCFNPGGYFRGLLPEHALNPLEMLKPGSPTLNRDIKRIARALVERSGSKGGKWFEDRARLWAEAFLRYLIKIKAVIGLPDLYRFVAIMEKDPAHWRVILADMLADDDDTISSAAGEIRRLLASDKGDSLDSIKGELTTALGFLNDPDTCKHLEAANAVSLERIVTERSQLYLCVTEDQLETLQPAIRAIIRTAMILKSRNPGGHSIIFLIDEAAQLGPGMADIVLKSYSFAAGAGVRTWSIWQSLGQIVRLLGTHGLQELLSSSETRQFFAVRDIETATVASKMIGMETTEFIDPKRQAEAEKAQLEAIFAMLDGGDVFRTMLEAQHYADMAAEPVRRSRWLMSPDEIMNKLPDDEQLLFVGGRNVPPMRLKRYPYWTSGRVMAGNFLPNPWHEPTDRVRLRGRFGMKTVPVIKQDVPRHLRDWPQFREAGMAHFPKGYRPF